MPCKKNAMVDSTYNARVQVLVHMEVHTLFFCIVNIYMYLAHHSSILSPVTAFTSFLIWTKLAKLQVDGGGGGGGGGDINIGIS